MMKKEEKMEVGGNAGGTAVPSKAMRASKPDPEPLQKPKGPAPPGVLQHMGQALIILTEMMLGKAGPAWVPPKQAEGGKIAFPPEVERHVIEAIIIAVRTGDKRHVEDILKLGQPDLDARGEEGQTPMEAAAAGGHADIIELLARHGARRA